MSNDTIRAVDQVTDITTVHRVKEREVHRVTEIIAVHQDTNIIIGVHQVMKTQRLPGTPSERFMGSPAPSKQFISSPKLSQQMI
jgi:hypothetical protein